MTFISTDRVPALLILQQAAKMARTADQSEASANDIIALAHGSPNKTGSTMQPSKVHSKISESLFSVNKISVVEEKLKLIERAGEALGVKQGDYASRDDFVEAANNAINKILRQVDGHRVIAQIEYDLGLNKLGVSLSDLVNSAKDPERRDNVTAALEKRLGNSKQEDQKIDPKNMSIFQDDAGTYSASYALMNGTLFFL